MPLGGPVPAAAAPPAVQRRSRNHWSRVVALDLVSLNQRVFEEASDQSQRTHLGG